MEWTELQAIWQQYDARIAENTRINKEILKRMLSTKPDRRVNWVMLQTGAGLLLGPILVLIIFSLPTIRFSTGIKLFLGILMYGGGCLISYFWSVKYFIMLRKINFTNPVTTTRKQINQAEKFQTKTLKIGYLVFMPIIFTGVFLLSDMRIPGSLSLYSITPLLLCIVVMIVTLYFRFRWKNWWFKKLNTELDEIEQLEKE